MQFITENGLDTWVRGNAQAAQGLIVELVAKLVTAASPKPREKRFPLGDSIGQHGPDGNLDAVISHEPYVPEGRSFWEVGTSLNAREKANSDYTSLTQVTPEAVRKEATFVFVTPLSGRRDWEHSWKEAGQITWVQEKKNLNEWKDIKVIDGTKLVDWIHQFITVELWLAEKTNALNQNQVSTLEQKWDLIKSIGEPPALSTGLFLANRDESCQKLIELIESENTFRLKLTTHFQSDTAAFVAAYVASLSEDKKQEVSSRAVIVSGEDAWNNLCARDENLILIADSKLDLDGEDGILLLQKARKKNHSVIFCGPKGGAPDPSSVILAMPRSHQVEEELKKAGYNEERARVLAQKSNGNLVYLLKYIQNLSIVPEWAQNTQGSDLKILALLGSWNENSESDKAAVESIVGKPYGEWITKIRSAAFQPSTPLTFRNGKWKLISRYEGWYALGCLLADEDLNRFQKMATELLKQKDPKFELEKDKRYAAQIYGKILPYSRTIKNGIADTLALLGSHPNALTQCSNNKAEYTARHIVRDVLNHADWQMWATIDDIMPLLAEAAPSEFLAALETEAAKQDSAFDEVFKQEGNGVTGEIYTTGILWGLETLAWDENYLARVTLCLGKLASRDPGGQYVNRPSNSLRSIFLPWYPQTTASIEKRISAVHALTKQLPDIGWKLVLQLLPESHSTTSGGRKPAWRSSIPDDWSRGVTNKDYSDQVTKYSEIAVEMAKGNQNRISELVEKIDNLPPAFCNVFLEYLGSDDFVKSPEDQRTEVWDALMNTIGRHRRFHDADWAMPKDAVDKIAIVADTIAPKQPENLYRRNFSNGTYDELDSENYESQMKAAAKKQENAILKIYNSGGIKKVRDFIPTVDMHYNVGRALGVVGEEKVDHEILPTYLDDQDKTILSFISSFVSCRFYTHGWDWVKKVILPAWTQEDKARLLSHLPFTRETWIEVQSILGESESLYWKICNANPYSEKVDLTIGITKLIENGRPNAAIDCLHKMIWDKKVLEPTLAVRALRESLKSKKPAGSRDGHHMLEVIKNLQANPHTPPDDLFWVEWGYLPLLDKHSGGTPITLERKLANDPDFFCEVIQLVFKSKKESKDKENTLDESRQAVASNAYRLIDHWRIPPGTKEDKTFDPSILKEWLKVVKEKLTESGHLEVGFLMIGHVLIYAPADQDSGLWINESVAEILNATDANDMRSGYRTATFNSRGVFHGTGGKGEMALSEAYKTKAEAIEAKGYIQFATTLRSLSESYKKQSEEAANEDRFDD